MSTRKDNAKEQNASTSTLSDTDAQTTRQRFINKGRFLLLPGSRLYATPWDASTVEVGHEYIRGPLLPPKDGHASDDDRPLLDNGTPEAKKVRFSIQDLTGSTAHDDFEYYDEFGSVPNSAASRTGFLEPPAVRPVLRNKGNNSMWIPESHPWWSDYEAIHWPPLISLAVAVLLTYPLLVLASIIARNRSLFWTRFVVGSASSILGFILGLALMEVGKRQLEAATWATIIHHSMYEGRSGITLADLEAKSTYPHFTWLGLSLLFERLLNPGTRRKNRPYDKRIWSLYIVFFVIISLVAASITFFLGRLVDITTTNVQQSDSYEERSIMGDLSPEDLVQVDAQLNAAEAFVQTWTLSPYGAGGQVPRPIILPWQGQEVFFTEVSEQILAGGTGSGTFLKGLESVGDTARGLDDFLRPKSDEGTYPSGSVLRFSRWGLRIQCVKLPNPQINIVPLSPSSITYAYIPKEVVSGLIKRLGFTDLQFSWNRTFLQNDDRVPENIDMEDIALVGVWWNNGVAQSFYSTAVDRGDNGNGWVELDVVMIRMNTTYTPYGSFGAYSPDNQIGYDAAVCVEAIEPWLVDTYNATTGHATSLKIVGPGGISSSPLEQGQRKGGEHPVRLNDTLSSVGKFPAFALAHFNSRNQILKDNGRDFWWVPNPTSISWTNGVGPRNYTSLSTEFLSKSLGKADAAQMLPYLVGSQPILTFEYKERTLASAAVFVGPTIAVCAAILALGFAAAFLVPRLPLGIPRRDFGVFTWLAAFEGDHLIHQAVKQGINKNMDLEELKRRYGNQKVRYGT